MKLWRLILNTKLKLTSRFWYTQVKCQNATSSIPIRAPDQPICNSVQCSKNTDDELDALIQKVAKSCRCGCQKQPAYLDLYSLCQGYNNYDPANYAFIQCVINKLSNPCYKEFYDELKKILNKGCKNVFQNNNFNIYTFLSDVCTTCNGCLDGCWIQSGSQILYATPAGATAKVLSAA